MFLLATIDPTVTEARSKVLQCAVILPVLSREFEPQAATKVLGEDEDGKNLMDIM
jgi:hypothetical protein